VEEEMVEWLKPSMQVTGMLAVRVGLHHLELVHYLFAQMVVVLVVGEVLLV
jgi:hypothetical protein